MKSGQGFLLVFSITSLASLNELYELREQIVRIKEDARVPLVIVGNKSDLEDDRAVSRARAFAVSEGWGHAPYYETSARRRANVDEAFVDLCRQIIRKDMAANGPSRGGSGRSGSGILPRDSDGLRGPKNHHAGGITGRKGKSKRSHQCNIL
jgi:Ras-related protein Rap-1B